MKRVLGFLLAVMLLCGMSVPAFSEEENDTADDLQDIIEREAVFFQILEECGLKREETKHQGLHEGTYFPSVSWSKYGHWFYATCNVVRDGVERAWWGFWYTEQDDYEIWYKLCRQYNWLIYHGIDLVEVEDQEVTAYQYDLPRLDNPEYDGAPAAFRYASQYELDHQMLKPIGNWTEFMERYNTAVKRDYIDADGKIPYKLEIQEKAVKVIPGDTYDTMEFEFTHKRHKGYNFAIKVWLEHGTENICRIESRSPHFKGNEGLLENVRRDIAWCVMEGLTGWDFPKVRGLELASWKRYAPSRYEETEVDNLMIRSVLDFEDEAYQKRKQKEYHWIKPQYFLIQGK